MNLSHDGSLNTTNVVIQNLNKLQSTRYVSLSTSANDLNREMTEMYSQQYGLLISVNRVYNLCRSGGI